MWYISNHQMQKLIGDSVAIPMWIQKVIAGCCFRSGVTDDECQWWSVVQILRRGHGLTIFLVLLIDTICLEIIVILNWLRSLKKWKNQWILSHPVCAQRHQVIASIINRCGLGRDMFLIEINDFSEHHFLNETSSTVEYVASPTFFPASQEKYMQLERAKRMLLDCNKG